MDDGCGLGLGNGGLCHACCVMGVPQVAWLLQLLSSCPDDLPVAPLQADLVSMAESLVAQAGQPHSQVKDVARGAKSSGCNFSGACGCLRACGMAGQVEGAPRGKTAQQQCRAWAITRPRQPQCCPSPHCCTDQPAVSQA